MPFSVASMYDDLGFPVRDGVMVTESELYGPPRLETVLGSKKSATPAHGTMPIISHGRFTLCKAIDRHAKDGKIYEALSKYLRRLVTDADDVQLIDDAVDTDNVARREAMIAKVAAIDEFCGTGMNPAFINISVSTSKPTPQSNDTSNGVLLWEDDETIVGIITYYYRENYRDVYIDGLCINQVQAYRGGSQLLTLFVSCLTSAGFPKFSLSSVPVSIPFYKKYGFIEKGGLGGLEKMTLTTVTKSNTVSRSSLSSKAAPRKSRDAKNYVNGGAMSRRNKSKGKRRSLKRGTRKRGTRKRCK